MNDAIAVESFIDFCDDMMITPSPANEATFNLLPKFQNDPKLAKYQNDIKQAELLLAKKSIDSKTDVQKTLNIIVRVYDIWCNICAIIAVPFAISIIGIPGYLLNRLLSLGANRLQEYITAQEAQKVLVAMNKAKSKAKTKEEKEKINKSIAKMTKIIKQLG